MQREEAEDFSANVPNSQSRNMNTRRQKATGS